MNIEELSKDEKLALMEQLKESLGEEFPEDKNQESDIEQRIGQLKERLENTKRLENRIMIRRELRELETLSK